MGLRDLLRRDRDDATPPDTTDTQPGQDCPPGCSVLAHNHGSGMQLYDGEWPGEAQANRQRGDR